MPSPKLRLNSYIAANPDSMAVTGQDRPVPAETHMWDESAVIGSAMGISQKEMATGTGEHIRGVLHQQASDLANSPGDWLVNRTVMLAQIANRYHAIALETQDDPATSSHYSMSAIRLEQQIQRNVDRAVKHGIESQSKRKKFRDMTDVERSEELTLRYKLRCSEEGKPFDQSRCDDWVRAMILRCREKYSNQSAQL